MNQDPINKSKLLPTNKTQNKAKRTRKTRISKRKHTDDYMKMAKSDKIRS